MAVTRNDVSTGPAQALRPSLPARWYYDPDQYLRELERIWYRDWVCVGRAEALADTGDYFTASIGTQSVIVCRDTAGGLRGFHNVCRHRGSLLCRHGVGRFRAGRIVCPYHTWTYTLDGTLAATPGRIDTADFDAGEFSLYPVHVDTWQGFVFVNLSERPAADLPAFLGAEADVLANWPLERMRSVHQIVVTVRCNWKLFWENYSECYHCPRLHPELCRVMPLYRQGVFNASNLPGWKPEFPGDTGAGRVADTAETWTLDGQSRLPPLEGLTEAERQAGVAFTSITGSMFVVAHPDYVRSVRIVPTGPESIELVVDWLLPVAHGEPSEEELAHMTGLATRVIRQDGDACELNQAGLHSQRFEHGVLVPQEHVLWEFHEWLRARLDAPDP